MISNSSVSLPGLDNCYQKTLPSNKVRHPYYIKLWDNPNTFLNHCGIVCTLSVMLMPMVLIVHWEDAEWAAKSIQFTTYQVSTFISEAYL